METKPRPTLTKCMVVNPTINSNANEQAVDRSIQSLPLQPLKDGHVRVEVEYSSLNFKDALCATGHPGVAKALPIVPGIDAAGMVVESKCDSVATGDQVMVFHAEFGTQSNGGYSQFVDVPWDWVYSVPDSMSTRDVMIVGTAGFTAAQCIDELQKHGIEPATGPIVVSGATGGVGVFAVLMLAQLGYEVVASTGKSDKADWLRNLGAKDVIDRGELNDTSSRPLLKGRWSGAVDTVGGNTLASIIRATNPHGCVTACGLVGGTGFNATVYPFILRGITLQGIDTAMIPRDYRAKLWQKIGLEWKINRLDEIAIEVTLEELDVQIEKILVGQIAGRVIVKL